MDTNCTGVVTNRTKFTLDVLHGQCQERERDVRSLIFSSFETRIVHIFKANGWKNNTTGWVPHPFGNFLSHHTGYINKYIYVRMFMC